MTEAGFARGPDGVWVSPNPAFGRMSFETSVLANPDSEAEMHIMADTWRRLGFDVRETVLAPALGADAPTLTSFSGVRTTSTPPGGNRFSQFTRERLPRPETRWAGQNKRSRMPSTSWGLIASSSRPIIRTTTPAGR